MRRPSRPCYRPLELLALVICNPPPHTLPTTINSLYTHTRTLSLESINHCCPPHSIDRGPQSSVILGVCKFGIAAFFLRPRAAMGHEPAASFTRSARDRPRPGSPSGRGTVSTRPARPGSPRRTSSTSAPTSPVGSPRTGAQSGAVKAHDLSEPLLSSWLDPLAPAASSQGNTDKELVQRHSETCKQLRAAHSARNELELQIAQLHALGPQAVWRKRILVAEAAGGAAEAEAARLRGERQKWSQRWQGLRTLLQAGQLEALRQARSAARAPLAQVFALSFLFFCVCCVCWCTAAPRLLCTFRIATHF